MVPTQYRTKYHHRASIIAEHLSAQKYMRKYFNVIYSQGLSLAHIISAPPAIDMVDPP